MGHCETSFVFAVAANARAAKTTCPILRGAEENIQRRSCLQKTARRAPGLHSHSPLRLPRRYFGSRLGTVPRRRLRHFKLGFAAARPRCRHPAKHVDTSRGRGPKRVEEGSGTKSGTTRQAAPLVFKPAVQAISAQPRSRAARREERRAACPGSRALCQEHGS